MEFLTKSPIERFDIAVRNGDAERARELLENHADVRARIDEPRFDFDSHSLLPAAAWWYRPESVRLMLKRGIDPHATGAHCSTALDRASFHGYADIVEILLALDPNPPLSHQNEFGGVPLGACVYGSLNGWKTAHPQDHARTLRLLLEAGSPVDATMLPTGNDALDTVVRDWLAADHGSSAL